jgi:hypothetical protein
MLPILALACLTAAADPAAPQLAQPLNTWVKRSPLPGGPPSPGLGYEGALAWDSKHRRIVRFAGHNQGGGGEQNAETWTFDPLTAKWELKEPNTSPPGACCNQQHLFDTDRGQYLRFPAFSGSHGWQWFREIYLSNSSVWSYDLGTNTWRDRRPVPAPRVAPLRCASWDSDYQVAVIFGGEGSNEGTLVYDPYTNTWHKLNPNVQPAPRSGGNMAYDAAAKKHLLFGTQFDEDRHTWAFDLGTKEWTDLKPKSMPPTDRNDALLAYDANAKKVIAAVRVIDRGEKDEIRSGHVETWAYDFTSNNWSELNPTREPDGWSNRSRVMVAMPELNALLLESVVNPTQKVKGVDREQQMWTYRLAEAKPEAILPPRNVRVRVEKEAALEEWDRVADAGGYIVFRGAGKTPWTARFRPVARIGKQSTMFRDTGVPRGTVAYYRVQTLALDGTQSESSPVVRAQPRVVDDHVATVVDAKRVQLAWRDNRDDLSGFHVERAPVEVYTDDQILRLKKDSPPLDDPVVGAIKRIGKFERLTKVPVQVSGFSGASVFNDNTVDLTQPTTVDGEATYTRTFAKEQLDSTGKPYRFGVHAYRLVAINKLGVESGPSAWTLTIPPAVEHVFAKEEGETCQLKWKAPGGDGIKGYRVYRMEGPKLNGPGQKVTRLTPEPIIAQPDRDGFIHFTDSKAAKETKRYWVVAVDRLGQEGIPSAPVWHWRQFRKYYEPFTGEWHQ